jgi:hypothetical protein
LRLNNFYPVSSHVGSKGFLHGSPFPSVVPSRVVFAEENIMRTYRAYLIDEDNRVSSYRPIEADTDADALQAARQFADGCDVEVWHLDRKIGRLERVKKE